MIKLPRDIVSLQQQLRSGEILVKDVCDYYLSNIHAHHSLNAIIHVFEDEIGPYIESIQSKLDSGAPLGRLFGLVVTIKDNICYKGHPCSAGSKILEGYKSPYSATAVEKLLKEDALIIASTNCDEFGMGSTSNNPHFGQVENGMLPGKIAGGSSGGSAVSVQMDMCMAALGSDTGGSVRQPAAFCGISGFKPTYGAISRYGLIAYGSSFDQIGIMAHDTETIRQIFEVIQGMDANDITSGITLSPPKLNATKPKMGIIKDFDNGSGAPLEDYRAFVKLMALDHEIVTFDFEYTDLLVPCYYILTTAEASANLARYDGVRYGHRANDYTDLEDMYLKSRTEGFGAEVKKRIILGTFVSSEGYYDAYLTQAQRVRRKIREAVDAMFEKVDFILCPTSALEPWEIGSAIADPLSIYMSDLYTVLASLSGHPAINIPLPLLNCASKIPHIQLIGRRGGDLELLAYISL